MIKSFTVNYHWDSGRKFYVASHKNQPIGRMELSRVVVFEQNIDLHNYGAAGFPIGKIFYMDSLLVGEEFRRCGVATKLLAECKKWAKVSKNIIILDAIPIAADTEQSMLLKFYKKNGFWIPPTVQMDPLNSAMIYHTRQKELQ